MTAWVIISCIPAPPSATSLIDARVNKIAEEADCTVTFIDNEWRILPSAIAQHVAIACLFHWALADEGVSVGCTYNGGESIIPFMELICCNDLKLASVKAMSGSHLLNILHDKTTQIVDARPLSEFLCNGLLSNSHLSVHLTGAISIPYPSVVNGGSFVPQNALRAIFEDCDIDFVAHTIVLGSFVAHSAAVATALALAGHTMVGFSLVPFGEELVNNLSNVRPNGISHQNHFVLDDGRAFDVSPESYNEKGVDREGREAIDKAYTDGLSKSAKVVEEDEVVWCNAAGERYFDMPQPVNKDVFLATSIEIYRMVSFVLAPFGLPVEMIEQFSANEVKSRCSGLFQDVIEVCSDIVYHHRGLNEGAMAMSVHKWVEKKRDPDCMEQVRLINDLLDTLYQPPVFIELPDMGNKHILEIAANYYSQLNESIMKRAPWVFNTSLNKEKNFVATTPSSWACMYPGTVYALGFLPSNNHPTNAHLSTCQIKSFIQAVAETTWNLVNDLSVSEIEFQALCDVINNTEARETLANIHMDATQTLYIMKHTLAQSLIRRDEEIMTRLVSVQKAADAGDNAYRSGDYDTSFLCYSQGLGKLPIYHHEICVLLVGRAQCLIHKGDLKRALLETQIILRIDPFHVGAYRCLAEIDEKQMAYESAMQHHVTAFILDGSRSPDYAVAIDRVARHVGRIASRDIFSAKVLQHDLPASWLVESYFDSFEHDVDYALAVPCAVEEMSDVHPNDMTTKQLLYRAIFFKRKREYTRSQEDVIVVLSRLEHASCERFLQAVALNLHASYLYVAGDVHGAIATINESLLMDPVSVNAHVKKGGFLSELGEMDEAMDYFKQAEALDSSEADIYLHMGQKELVDGNYQEAVQYLRRSLSRSESLPVTHVSYGMALYRSGSIYQATNIFEEAAKRFPQSPEVHLFYGEVLADQGDYANAMRYFFNAYKLSPKCPLPFLNAGRVCVNTNDPMRAISHFLQALIIDPRCSAAHLDIAQVLFAQGRTTEAFNHFELARQCCRFLPEIEEACAATVMAKMQEQVTDILGVDLRHIMRTK